jgi:hypothetical protein
VRKIKYQFVSVDFHISTCFGISIDLALVPIFASIPVIAFVLILALAVTIAKIFGFGKIMVPIINKFDLVANNTSFSSSLILLTKS